MDVESDIEDNAIDTDEVNYCFRQGISLEGTMYLERVEKQAMDQKNLGSEEKLIKIFDHLTRKIDKSGSDGISVLREFERFGLSSEVILKLGHIFIDTQQSSSPRSPRGAPNPPQLSGSSGKKGSERYDDDFDDYESDDFEEDDLPSAQKSNPYHAHTYSSISTHPTPKYIDEDPLPRASRSAPTGAGVSSGSMQMEPRESPKYGMHSSKFKGTSLSWIKKGQWQKGEKIGSGSFGEVFQGMTDGGMLFAVKILNYSQNTKEINNLTSEIELMQTLCHPNIVQYLGASVDEDRGFVNIFQEWVPGGSIAHLLKRFGAFRVGVVRTYTRQILEGLNYLHHNGIVHRDIKGGNILVDDVGHVKLADFGASQKMAMGETQATTEIKGTPYFMAPEVLSDSRYGRRGDVWAMGCTIIQMLTGDPPWKDLKLQSIIQLHVHLSNFQGIPPVNNQDLPPALRAFLELCFTKDHRKRPMVDVLLEHPFLCLTDEELNESMASGNDDVVQQLNRAVARASTSLNPNDTFGSIDQQIAARRKQRKANNNVNVDSNLSGGTVEIPSPSAVPSPTHTSPPITTPPSANNPFAKSKHPPRSSTANASVNSRHAHGNDSDNYPRHQESASAQSSPMPRGDRGAGKDRYRDREITRRNQEPLPASKSNGNSDHPPRSKASPRYAEGNSDDDTPRSSRQPTSARGHSRESSRESNAVRRGSDSSNGDEGPRSYRQPPTSARGHSRDSSRESNAVRRGSDSSAGSVDKPSRRKDYDGVNSSEITPRVVQEVGSHSSARKDSGSKNIRQKVLSNSNDRIRRHSGEKHTIKTSASTTSMRSGDRERGREEDRRPVTSAEKSPRNIHSSTSHRHESSTNPDERVIRQVQADVYSESQSYYDEHGTGFNEVGEEDGSWMCLKPTCQNITFDNSITYCEKCATVRGASGLRGDNVRLSMIR